jgi:hypothetical protein
MSSDGKAFSSLYVSLKLHPVMEGRKKEQELSEGLLEYWAGYRHSWAVGPSNGSAELYYQNPMSRSTSGDGSSHLFVSMLTSLYTSTFPLLLFFLSLTFFFSLLLCFRIL